MTAPQVVAASPPPPPPMLAVLCVEGLIPGILFEMILVHWAVSVCDDIVIKLASLETT